MRLVVGQRVVELPRGDQVAAVELHHARIVRIFHRQRRSQVVDLQVKGAVKIPVAGDPVEIGELVVERHFIAREEPPRVVERGGVVAPFVVEFAVRGQYGDARRIDAVGLGELYQRQRIFLLAGIQLAQQQMILGLVGGGFDERLRFGYGAVVLAGSHQQAAFEFRQGVDPAETHLRRIEHGDRREGLPLLVVEHRQHAVGVGILRVDLAQPVVGADRVAVAVVENLRLPQLQQVPFVGRVGAEGAFGMAQGGGSIVVKQQFGQFVPCGPVGRIGFDGAFQRRAGRGGVPLDEGLLDPFGEEVESPERVGHLRRRRDLRGFPGESAAEDRSEQEQKEWFSHRRGCHMLLNGTGAALRMRRPSRFQSNSVSNWRRKRTSFSK